MDQKTTERRVELVDVRPEAAEAPEREGFLERWWPALLLAGIGLLWLVFSSAGDSSNDEEITTVNVRRDDLTISVLEGGNLATMEAVSYLCEVSGSAGAKIKYIVEEGYMVTPEDVENGKILCELDSTDLRERIVGQEVSYQSSLATFKQAEEDRTIEASQAESAIRDARLTARFALLDFLKYVGEEAGARILHESSLPFDLESMTAFEDGLGEATEFEEDQFTFEGIVKRSAPSKAIDFPALLEGDRLGDGEAQQVLRNLEDQRLVSRNEVGIAEETTAASRKLAEQEFITRTALENDEMMLDKARLDLKSSETLLNLFKDYEFPKIAEERLSDYQEALSRLSRSKSSARQEIEQENSQYLIAERKYQVELRQLQELEVQLQSCTMRARKPGLVAYGAPNVNYFRSYRWDAVAEGATVVLRQPIITIPDMTQMSVKVNVHESYIKRVTLGQRARIVLDSEPDEALWGEVTELAVLPDSSTMRYNPTLKLYPAEITIEGGPDWLKPGMSAEVEIIVNELEDVIQVPVQAVFSRGNRRLCFIDQGSREPEQREVEIGEFNDSFVEIREGLEEGELVYLSAPADFDDQLEEKKNSAPEERPKDPEKKAKKPKKILAGPAL